MLHELKILYVNGISEHTIWQRISSRGYHANVVDQAGTGV